MADFPDTSRLDAQVENLRRRGVALPRNTARAQLSAATMHDMALQGPKQRHSDFASLSASSSNAQAADIEGNNRLIRAMGNQRSLSRRQGSGGGGGDVFAAIPRFYDPLEYWDLSGLPWNVADEGHRHKLHKWMRLYYATHYLVPILIDIFTRFPLVGMEVKHPDKQLADFYEDLFLNQLNYPEFLVSLGREYWTVGEAFPLGSFNEELGIWEREELINPEDVVIEKFPLLGEQELKIVPPEYLKKLAQTKSPAKEYRLLEINFPELIPYLRKNEHIPISSVLLRQVANLHTDWDDHGTPILLRGLRTLIHEEKLLASQDAIAERLFSPLILAKLGVMDLQDGQGPWIPSPDELDAFRDDLDIALSSDFRVLVHHFGIEMENVFGREQMPRLGDDFDRIERRVMQIFGVNPSLLSAGSSSQPYASSALQAEFLNQILRTFQGYLKNHFRERALVVAEAHKHYEYDLRGETRVPVMEEVAKQDPETGEWYRETVHKLTVPELSFATLDLRDEATERQFLQSMRTMGVPIPDAKLMVGIDMDIDEMVAEYNEELVTKTIAQQENKMKAYKALQAKGLPIPPDLEAEVQSALQKGPGASPGAPVATPSGGPGPAMGPGDSPIVMPTAPPGVGGSPSPFGMPQLGPGGMGGPVPGGGPPPMAPGGQGIGNGFAPPASYERRPGMPRPSSVQDDIQRLSSENAEPFGTVAPPSEPGPLRTRDRNAKDETVDRLPKAKVRKSYSFVDDPDDLDEEEDHTVTESESTGQSSSDSGEVAE